MIKISDRLSMVASLLGNANVIADIGCDHGYLPIYLLETGAYSSAIAMDINEGPLSKARENIKLHNLDNRIDVRISDGVSALKQGEAVSVCICGMGGNVMMHIFDIGDELLGTIPTIVIQPQSEYALLRKCLLEKGYVFVDEDIVLEDGKYYFAWKLRYDNDMSNKSDTTSSIDTRDYKSTACPDVKFCYSPILFKRRDKVYKAYIESYRATLTQSIQSIQSHSPGNHRLESLEYECSIIDYILDKYYN